MPQCCAASGASWKTSPILRQSETRVSGNPCGPMAGFADRESCHSALHVRRRLQVHVFQSFAETYDSQGWRTTCTPPVLSISREETMEGKKLSIASASVAILAATLGLGTRCKAQDQTQEPPREATIQAPEQQRQKADGERHGLPIETYAVAPGTKFLVRLEDELGTKDIKENEKFKVRTLEPLEAGSGIYLPAGAEVRGHISHVEPAGVAGRAKLWLTFDEIRTKFGSLPIVAEVVSVPGDHSVKSGTPQEGLIEGRSSNQHDAAEA